LPDPVYAGHSLVGWAYDDAGVTMVGATDDITEDDTIYAIWETLYTVTYTLNSGVNAVGNPATFVAGDLPITLLPATRALYTFDGWFEEVGLTTPVTTITVAENTTVYAKFTIIE